MSSRTCRLADENLTGTRLGRKTRRDIDVISQCGEIHGAIFPPDHADIRGTGVNAYPHRKPGSAGLAVTREAQQFLSRLDGLAWVVRPGKARNIETDCFISHQSIYKRICLYHDMRRDRIKAIDELAELLCTHLLSQFC